MQVGIIPVKGFFGKRKSLSTWLTLPEGALDDRNVNRNSSSNIAHHAGKAASRSALAYWRLPTVVFQLLILWRCCFAKRLPVDSGGSCPYGVKPACGNMRSRG